MFRTVSLSIIISLVMYTQQQVYVIQVCWLLARGIRMERSSILISITCMTYTYCCEYGTRLMMMDRETVRNM